MSARSAECYQKEDALKTRRSLAVRPLFAHLRAPVRMLRFDGFGGVDCTPNVILRLPLRLEITVKNLLRSKLNTTEKAFLIRVLCSDSSEPHYALSNRNTVQTHYRCVALRHASAACQARWRRTCVWCHCCCWRLSCRNSTGLQVSGCIAFHI